MLAMVLALCPFMTFAEETTDAVVSIAAFTNGTVAAGKERYKIGETVTLTIAPDAPPPPLRSTSTLTMPASVATLWLR